MKVQVHTDNHIECHKHLTEEVEASVESALDRFGDEVSRVEVHLSDENGHKAGNGDKRCMMEARLAGLRPIAVIHHGSTLQQAIDGAAERLEKTVDSTLERRRDH